MFSEYSVANSQRRCTGRRRQRRVALWVILVVWPGAPAQKQIDERPPEVATRRDEDEEIAGVVRERQPVHDELHLPVVQIASPRDVIEHLRNK